MEEYPFDNNKGEGLNHIERIDSKLNQNEESNITLDASMNEESLLASRLLNRN